ncbi:MAG: hypothetical protein LBN95_00420 [Prevotellaceae bacterium]|jgi:hypothetical protein|nr:hypothetical protein [Prevotellaceae bacterium]
MRNKLIIILLIISILPIGIVAQNNTNSPYTRFGYGKLVDASFGRTSAMGGATLGFRSKSTINPANPASYSCIDSTSFLFEMGVSGLFSNYSLKDSLSGKISSTSKVTGNLDSFAMQFPVTKWLGMSAGIIPYSFAGYNFATKDSTKMPHPTNDSLIVRNNQTFSGSGGISQVYLGLSVDLFKRLSLGVNGYYMFGSVVNKRSVAISSTDGNITYDSFQDMEFRVNSFNMRFGLQYHQPLRQGKDMLVVGAIYEFQSPFHSTSSATTVSLVSGSTADTVASVARASDFKFELPNVYGGGISYLVDNKLLINADFQYQQFASAQFMSRKDTLNNRMKISGGVEYIHKPNGNRYIDRMSWRIGGNYTNSYINVNGFGTKDFALTAGVGFPFLHSKSVLNLNFEYGKIGSMANSLLNEQYFRLGVNLTLNENWFFKPVIH